MALAWIDNELFLKHKGVTVYRLYKNDSHDNPFTYLFGFSSCTSESDDDTFDIRDLYKGSADEVKYSPQAIIRRAIDEGKLRMPQEGEGVCTHPWQALEVAQDDKGLYVLCSLCPMATRDLKNWYDYTEEDNETPKADKG